MHECYYYTKHDGDKVICQLCPHHCTLSKGQIGICKIRENRAGKFMTYHILKLVQLQLILLRRNLCTISIQVQKSYP
jgi:pyruvate formate lyase activating enzyme